MSYAHTYCRRTSANSTRLRARTATRSSCSVDARLMRGAAFIGMGRAVSLTTIFDEHYPMLCDMALRTNKRVVLNTTESHRVVRDHVGQINSPPQ
jgi:hypothetical protein